MRRAPSGDQVGAEAPLPDAGALVKGPEIVPSPESHTQMRTSGGKLVSPVVMRSDANAILPPGEAGVAGDQAGYELNRPSEVTELTGQVPRQL